MRGFLHRLVCVRRLQAHLSDTFVPQHMWNPVGVPVSSFALWLGNELAGAEDGSDNDIFIGFGPCSSVYGIKNPLQFGEKRHALKSRNV